MKSGNEIRAKYLAFMKEKGHAVIPSSALVPENDPTTLFTSSGMQPLIPYLIGQPHPMGVRLVNSQKCFRSNDIEDVGDNRHTTFFEMLGNWSLGDYYKKDQLRWFFSFLVDEVGLDPKRIYVTVFAGDEALGIPKDEESVAIWKELFKERGIEANDVYIGTEENGYEVGLQGGRIFYYDAKKNWWSRSGTPDKMPEGEIGGPDSEVFYDFGEEFATDPRYKDLEPHPNSDSGQFIEIGNSVFIEYQKQADGTFLTLKQKNVDFGGGLERIAAAAALNPDVFKVDLLHNVVAIIERLSGKRYEEHLTAFRVVTDHLRGAVFLLADGVTPGNVDQSYFVRRLLRRAVRFADTLGVPEGNFANLADAVIDTFGDYYTGLKGQSEKIKNLIAEEEAQFRTTIKKGLNLLNKEIEALEMAQVKQLSAKTTYDLFTTYGFPSELTEEIAAERGITIDQAGFKQLMEEHRALSRSGAEQKFKGGLADHSEKVIHYHTATHLMLAALRKVLGDHVHQAGSNITGERLRYDFNHHAKMTDEEIKAVEEYVNNAIQKGGEVFIEILPKASAQADASIEASFWDRYPEEVKVYTMKGTDGTIFSRELCGGPHVESLGTITGTFKITKEESSAAGIRRIKAILV